jgi:hypothetical protein
MPSSDELKQELDELVGQRTALSVERAAAEDRFKQEARDLTVRIDAKRDEWMASREVPEGSQVVELEG